MRTCWWWIGSVSLILVALALFPSFSVAQDCSYNQAFNPPLAAGGIGCVAAKSLKSKGLVEISEDAPMEVKTGVVLKVRAFGESPGSLVINPNGSLVSGVSFPELSDPVIIDAAKDIISNGYLRISTPEDTLRLRAAKSLQLQGQGATGDTELEADSLKLESSKGSILLDGVSISAEYLSEINAFKGRITIKNSTFRVGEDDEEGAEPGPCRFYARDGIEGLDDPSNHFDCLIIAP
jgi:hypothetical protein